MRAERARRWIFRLNRERRKFVEQQTASAARTFFDAYRSGDNPYRRLLFKPRCVDQLPRKWEDLPFRRFENFNAGLAISMESLRVTAR
jgi:hypothetical protein